MSEAVSPFSEPIIAHNDIVRFCGSHVNLKKEDAADYRKQVNNLREKLATFVKEHPDYGLIKMLLNGSLAKGLGLKTLNDIDVALYLDADKVPSGNDELIAWLVTKLRKAYPQMAPEQIQPSTHCVQITFKGTGLKVDVAPVWAIDGDDDDHGYLLNRETGQRVLTSIPRHLRFTRRRKERQLDHYAQVVRLVKWWVKQKKAESSAFRMKSFLVEMVVAHLADRGQDWSRYPSGLQAVFRYIVQSMMKERVSFSDYYPASKLPGPTGAAIEVFDPVNPDNNVSFDYTESDRRVLVDTAEDALDAITEAQFATTKAQAVACWQRILGPAFRG